MAEEAAKKDTKKDVPQPEVNPEIKGLKVILFLNLGVLVLSLAVSIYAFIKLRQPQHIDLKPLESPVTGQDTAEQNQITLERFIVNLSNTDARSVVNLSFQIIFSNETNMEYVSSQIPKIRDLAISIISSKNEHEMTTVEGREKLKEQMKTSIDRIINQKGKALEVLFTNFYLSREG